MNKNVLYLSYDGMTDPLGQSQVLPYLVGLSEKGWNITLVSAEKYGRSSEIPTIVKICEEACIRWVPVRYHKSPPLLSTIKDVKILRKTAYSLHKEHNFAIVHCRSYISALVGLRMQKKFGVKFLFDMRGFWADERVDGKLWNLKNPIFKKVYKYFKTKEKQFLLNADHTISLTSAGKCVICDDLVKEEIPVTVIPCCADTSLFDPHNINIEYRSKIAEDLRFTKETRVLGYVGSLGTWYLLEEMLSYFEQLRKERPEFVFLLITLDDANKIYSVANKLRIPKKSIIVRGSKRHELPSYLALMDCSIFFIKPAFSKQASSPTKQGELMAMGIPVIANTGVGDTAQIITKYQSGVNVTLSDPTSVKESIDHIDEILRLDREKIREGALQYFSLKEGIEKYNHIYELLTSS